MQRPTHRNSIRVFIKGTSHEETQAYHDLFAVAIPLVQAEKNCRSKLQNKLQPTVSLMIIQKKCINKVLRLIFERKRKIFLFTLAVASLTHGYSS